MVYLLPKPTTVYKNVHATDMFDKNVPLNMTNPDKFISKTSIIHKKYYDGHWPKQPTCIKNDI